MRSSPLSLTPAQFRAAGYALVDRVAEMLESLAQQPVTPADEPAALRALLGSGGMPSGGADPERLLDEASRLVLGHSLFNGHPRFFGYITSSAAPIGILADLLAAAANPNVGAWELSPIATEIEVQTVRWVAELVGYPANCGGLLVSGGNMANFLCFLTGRRAISGEAVRSAGVGAPLPPMAVYVSAETHTWIKKAADLFGHGTDAIRWIATDAAQRMDMSALRRAIAEDRARGMRPMMVVGTAGSVSTGAVDPLADIAALCREEKMWFHADGAYGAPATLLSNPPAQLRALSEADSVAVDPHKWLYAPLEAGCVLVRNADALRDAFSYTPNYYHFDHAGDGEAAPPVNFYELGMQNSRGFRALKVWLGLRQAGRDGFAQLIEDDCRLTRELFERVKAHPELEAVTCALSIATFRYVPADARGDDVYLDQLNEELLSRLKLSGEIFPSNAVVNGRFLLRTCIVNFRTDADDIAAVPEIVVRHGRAVHAEMRQGAAAGGGAKR